MIDLRSDTVTKPTDAMRRAMAEAEVGDDVLGDDPTVARLEADIAERLGKEAALFVPSGTMSNLIAIRLHCRPGDEILCEQNCHVIQYEQAGYAQLNGVAAHTCVGVDGIPTVEQFAAMLRPENVHMPRSRAILLENTHNRGGGRVHAFDEVERICRWAIDHGLSSHLDGARLFNAVAATGRPANEWGEQFDTVSICFSKGLGAPVGSALCGPKDWIADARRHRKVLGGGMRQSGVLAAAALHALEHHVERLVEDHANAQRLADGVRTIDELALSPEHIDTNMVFFEVDPAWGTAEAFREALAERGVACLALGPARIRMVTHLDVSSDDIDRALDVLRDAVRKS